MTLTVNPYKFDPLTDKIEYLTQDFLIAGVEAWRRDVWGAEIVRSLGCRLLPSLETTNVYAEGADLDHLEAEVAVLLQNVGLVAAQTGTAEESLRVRLENMLVAIRIARELGAGHGGVSIE